MMASSFSQCHENIAAIALSVPARLKQTKWSLYEPLSIKKQNSIPRTLLVCAPIFSTMLMRVNHECGIFEGIPMTHAEMKTPWARVEKMH